LDQEHVNGHVGRVHRDSRDPAPGGERACEEWRRGVAFTSTWGINADGEGFGWRRGAGDGRCGEGEAREVFGDVPVEAAVVGGGALGDVDAGDAQGFFGDFGGAVGRGGDGEVAGDEDEFVVGTWWEVLIRDYEINAESRHS
jgi:hypothetical protein